jgi:hypothetical protein
LFSATEPLSFACVLGRSAIWPVVAVVLLSAGALVYFVGDVAGDSSPAAQRGDGGSSNSDTHPAPTDPEPATKRSDRDGGGSSVVASGEKREAPAWILTNALVRKHEALPCTDAGEPINFEVFSAGPSVGDVPVTSSIRRCDAGALEGESPDNYFAYVYGHCEPEPDIGCLPPLQIRSYPACERAYSDYSFEGKPLPYNELPSIDGAKVYEIEFITGPRIEIYTGVATIVISAADPALAQEALTQLVGQEAGETPATTSAALNDQSDRSLEAPAIDAIEGGLPCEA